MVIHLDFSICRMTRSKIGCITGNLLSKTKLFGTRRDLREREGTKNIDGLLWTCGLRDERQMVNYAFDTEAIDWDTWKMSK